MYSRKLFYCNSGVYMNHFIFYAIFMNFILTTGNANYSSTSSTSTESTDNLSDTTLSSTTFTQTNPSATTETADVTGKTGTSTPVGSEGTGDTSLSSDNVSSESSNTESSVARQNNKSVIANVVGQEYLDVRTTESESSVSLMTTLQESETSTTEIVSSSTESGQEKHRTTVIITDNPKIVTSTPKMNGVSSLKVFHILQLLILFTLQIVY